MREHHPSAHRSIANARRERREDLLFVARLFGEMRRVVSVCEKTEMYEIVPILRLYVW